MNFFNPGKHFNIVAKNVGYGSIGSLTGYTNNMSRKRSFKLLDVVYDDYVKKPCYGFVNMFNPTKSNLLETPPKAHHSDVYINITRPLEKEEVSYVEKVYPANNQLLLPEYNSLRADDPLMLLKQYVQLAHRLRLESLLFDHKESVRVANVPWGGYNMDMGVLLKIVIPYRPNKKSLTQKVLGKHIKGLTTFCSGLTEELSEAAKLVNVIYKGNHPRLNNRELIDVRCHRKPGVNGVVISAPVTNMSISDVEGYYLFDSNESSNNRHYRPRFNVVLPTFVLNLENTFKTNTLLTVINGAIDIENVAKRFHVRTRRATRWSKYGVPTPSCPNTRILSHQKKETDIDYLNLDTGMLTDKGKEIKFQRNICVIPLQYDKRQYNPLQNNTFVERIKI